MALKKVALKKVALKKVEKREAEGQGEMWTRKKGARITSLARWWLSHPSMISRQTRAHPSSQMMGGVAVMPHPEIPFPSDSFSWESSCSGFVEPVSRSNKTGAIQRQSSAGTSPSPKLLGSLAQIP